MISWSNIYFFLNGKILGVLILKERQLLQEQHITIKYTILPGVINEPIIAIFDIC